MIEIAPAVIAVPSDTFRGLLIAADNRPLPGSEITSGGWLAIDAAIGNQTVTSMLVSVALSKNDIRLVPAAAIPAFSIIMSCNKRKRFPVAGVQIAVGPVAVCCADFILDVVRWVSPLPVLGLYRIGSQ